MILRRSRLRLVAAILLTSAACAMGQENRRVVPLPQAHAHNDYRHDRPLIDALAHGFCSVEADIFLVDGQLLVGHGRSELKPGRTLERLYLDPLRRRVRQNDGQVYPGGPTFTLLIDIKSSGEKTYRALRKVLAEYSDILTCVRGDESTAGAVTVVISGNRARATIAADGPRFAGIDGRLSDLDTDKPSHLMPWISDRWGQHFSWRGEGSMPGAEREKLRAIVEKAHQAGRRVRFWATPENTAVWQELHAAGVDLINTDDLAGLQRFLLSRISVTGGR
jgi:hypothetical protein